MVVLPNTHDINYVKRNDVRLKPGKNEEFNRILLEFIKSVEGKVKGLKGFIVMNSTNNASEVIGTYLYGKQNLIWKCFIIHPTKLFMNL